MGEGGAVAACIFREKAKWAVISGNALMGLVPLSPGPPDAPLDVQIEPGPSPGILIISWLPVTIDAAGTSNGVRVTGYAIYADGQKVRPGDSAHPYPGGRTGGSLLATLRGLVSLAGHRAAWPLAFG